MVDNKIQGGIIGIVMLLLGFGGSQLLDQETFDNSYVCTVNENLGVFTGNSNHPAPLSKTKLTGYWIDENGKNRISRCSGGSWQTLESYAESNGVNIESLIQAEVSCPAVNIIAYTDQGKYFCDSFGPNGRCISEDEIFTSLG